MSQDLDLYQGGDLQPYQPGGDLAPITPADDWGEQPDYLSERSIQPLPSQQAEQQFAQLANIFQNDFSQLGHPQQHIDAALKWFKQALISPPKQQQKRNSYKLYQYSNDHVMIAFANFAQQQGFSQKFIENVCWWVNELENRMYAAQQQVRQTPVSSDPTDNLSDAEYDRVVAANEQARANTLGRLKDMWGSSYEANMRVVQRHFASLTDAEQDMLSKYTTGWIKGTNTFEIVTSLYAQAVHAHTIPRSGAAIAQEIQNIEHYMKENRAAYMKDELTQARYRELLNLQGGR